MMTYERDDDTIEAVWICRGQTRTARVEHFCGLCGERILPGQRYTRKVMRVDGEMSVYSEHLSGVECEPH